MPTYPYYTVRTGGVVPAVVQLEMEAGDTDLDAQDVVDAVRTVLQALPGSPTVTATRYDITSSDL